jgi:hypothetical protein
LELQQIGIQLQQAICRKQAYNPAIIKIRQMSKNIQQSRLMVKEIFGKNKALPTLVQYADKKNYPNNIYKEILKWLPKLNINEQPDSNSEVSLWENIDPEIDLVTSLFYKITDYGYGQILSAVKKIPKKIIRQIIESYYQGRGKYDQVSREAATGGLTFDVLIDIGAYRDLNRHRNVIHIIKEPHPVYGYAIPDEIRIVGLEKSYWQVIKVAEKAYLQIEKKHPGVGQYILPQATLRRVLMRMTPWELQYLTELRTRPQGHFSYRRIANLMYQEFNKKYPDWGRFFRITPPDQTDFWQR